MLLKVRSTQCNRVLQRSIKCSKRIFNVNSIQNINRTGRRLINTSLNPHLWSTNVIGFSKQKALFQITLLLSNTQDLIPFSSTQQISTPCCSLTSAIFTSDCHVSASGASVKEVTRFLKEGRQNLQQYQPTSSAEDILAFSSYSN